MIKYFGKHVKRYLHMFLLFLLLSFITYSIELIIPFTLSKFIDSINLNKSVNIIWSFGKILIILTLFYLVCIFYKQIIFAKYSSKVIYSMLDECICHVEKLPLTFIDKFNPAYLAQRIDNDVSSIVSFVFFNLCNSIMKIISVIALGIVILTINIKLFWILIAVAILNCGAYLFYNKLLFKNGFAYQDACNHFNALINDRLTMVKQTKVNAWFNVVSTKLTDYYKVVLKKNLAYTKTSTKLENIGNFTGNISLILLVFFGGLEIINNNFSIGNFVLVYTYSNICIKNMQFFLSLGQNYQHTKACYARILEILNMEQEHNGSELINDIDSIEVRNLSFSHNNDKKLYSGLNLSFKKGNIYCIKGENGVGKSTLMDIILGVRYDYEGDIFYNNKSLRILDSYYLRKKLISVVEQEPNIIKVPLKENLTFGLKTYDEHKLESLCKNLSINNRVNAKSEDINLSGGEKQKICEIRALLKNPKVLILDEPISALDSISITKLKEILNEEKKDKIILMITHNEEIEDIVDEFITLKSS